MSIWIRRPEIAWEPGDDRVVVFDLRTPADAPVTLSGSGAAIWTAVDGSRDTAQLVAVVAEEFGQEPHLIAAEVAAFLEELEGRGLVESQPGGA